jgi:hypothetical protein
MNEGFVQEYYSGLAFHSLKGINFTKPKQERMTDNHTMVPSLSSLSSVSFIDTQPANKYAIRGIRFQINII